MRESLEKLLSELRRVGITVALRNGQPVLRGEEPNAGLRAAIQAHKPHLVRLAVSDAKAGNGGTEWQRALSRADDQVREAWALLAAGGEVNGGMDAEAAEWWAWETLQESAERATCRP